MLLEKEDEGGMIWLVMSSSPVERIKEKLNILDVVSPYVSLKKAGKSYKGKSPFNNEKTPSFFVHPDKGFFYDFSAGFGGDIFTFIQKIERVDFPEALRILAEKAGVSLSEDQFTKHKNSERDRLFEILESATKWYEVQLRKNREVVDYLLERGLAKESIVRFRIGFAPEGWRNISSYLKGVKKFQESDIEKTGLIIEKEGSGFYDRFRSRIMFPLFDDRGRVVAFSGRIWGNDEGKAKYINSPEGSLYHKSDVLYPYHLAKSAFSQKDFAILVEGQFDVVLSHQSGYENTVALSGTGLTDSHIEKIKRFTKNIYLALDADRAGIKATRRSLFKAYEHGMHVKVILLEQGEDPADTIRRSRDAWDIAVKQPLDYLDYRILLAEKEQLSFEQKQSLVYDDLFDFVFFMRDPLSRDFSLEKISRFLGRSLDSVREAFQTYRPREDFSLLQGRKVEEGDHKFERTPFSFSHNQSHEEEMKREFFFFMSFLESLYPEEFLVSSPQFKEEYERIHGSSYEEDFSKLSDEEKAMALFVLEEEFGEKPYHFFEEKVKVLLANMELKKLEQLSQKIKNLIQREQVLYPDRIPKALMKESSDILKKIDKIKSSITRE